MFATMMINEQLCCVYRLKYISCCVQILVVIKWVVIETTGVCDATSFAIHTDQICDS